MKKVIAMFVVMGVFSVASAMTSYASKSSHTAKSSHASKSSHTAKSLHCSVRPPKETESEALPAMAKVSKETAQSTAMKTVGGHGAAVQEGELEVEHGCLVYSFDVRQPGHKGATEVLVDAGNGKVLSRKHESARAEAAEKAKDRAAATK